MDTMRYSNANLELRCNEHKRKISYIYLKDDQKSNLACRICIQQYKFDNECLIDLDSLLEEVEDEDILMNFPPCLSKKTCEYIANNKTNKQSHYENVIEAIHKQFDTYSKLIMNALDKHKKSLINHIHSIEDHRISLMNTYNEVQSKKEISQKIKELSQQPNELNSYLKDLTSYLMNSSQNKKKTIKQSILNHKNEVDQINLESINKKLQNILDNIELISFQKYRHNNAYDGNIISLPKPNPMLTQTLSLDSIEKLIKNDNIASYERLNLTFDEYLSEGDLEQLSKCLYGCKWVKTLYFYSREANDQLISALGQSLCQMSALSILQIELNSNPNITKQGFNDLCEVLQSYCQNIMILQFRFSYNPNITDEVIDSSIIPVLQSQSNLCTLKLEFQNTSITGKSISLISKSIKNLSNLNRLKLNFNDNNIDDDEAFIELSNSIKEMKQILVNVTLQFQENQISYFAAMSLINAFCTCHKLEKLNLCLSENKITVQCREIVEKIRQQMKSNICKNLKECFIMIN